MRNRVESRLSYLGCAWLLLCLALGFACLPESLRADDVPQKPPPAPSQRPWFERVLVGMEVGPTGAQFGGEAEDVAYAARFNGRDIVRRSVDAHSEYLVIWARDGAFTYYDSKVQPKAPGLGERDVLRETVEEARRHRLPVIAYCVLQYPSRALQDHPEWKMRDKDRKPIDYLVCFNSGYVEMAKKLLTEMLGYGIDGFHLDMVDQGFGAPHGCWCDRCQALFEAEHGRPMPKGITWDEDWDRMLEFRYTTSERFEKILRDHVRSVNPKATVDFNYHGNPPFSWEVGQRPVQHAGNADFVTGETGTWGFSALGVGLNAEFYRASTPGLPFQVAMQRGVRMYHDQTTRPLNDIRWELLTLISHGAFVTMVDKTAYDGWLDPVGYERTGAAFREVLAKRGHFGQRPVCDVGLYFSSRSRDWYGRDKPARYFQSFQGAHKACVYEHIPFGVVLDENVSLEGLERFPVVCLANVTILSEREVRLFRRYVEAGGKLLVTGQSGCYDRMGEPLAKSALGELVGAKLVRRLESVDNHVKLEAKVGERLRTGIPADWPFLVKGPAAVYEPTGAAPSGKLLKPHRTLRQKQGKDKSDWPMSADAPVGPAVLVHKVGKGTVLTLAAAPGFAIASEHHITEARRLFRNAVRMLHPEPLVEVRAPASVEAVVSDDAASRTLRIHLLGYNSPPQTTPATNRPHVLPGLIEDAPMYRATIQVRRNVKSAKALNTTTELKHSGGRIDVTVNDIHEVVVVGY